MTAILVRIVAWRLRRCGLVPTPRRIVAALGLLGVSTAGASARLAIMDHAELETAEAP